ERRLALPGGPQQRLDEVAALAAAAPDAVQAARPNDQVPRAQRPHQVLAGQLAHAVDVDRARGVLRGVWRRPRLVQAEDVIAAEMDQQGVQVAADEGQLPHTPGVDGERRLWFALGPVHEVVGRTVADHVGAAWPG